MLALTLVSICFLLTLTRFVVVACSFLTVVSALVYNDHYYVVFLMIPEEEEKKKNDDMMMIDDDDDEGVMINTNLMMKRGKVSRYTLYTIVCSTS